MYPLPKRRCVSMPGVLFFCSLFFVFSVHCRNTAIWLGAPTSGSSGPTGAKISLVAVGDRDALGPGLNSAPVHSKRWSAWRNVPAVSVRSARCTRRSAWSIPPRFGRAHSNSTRSKAAKRAGSRSSITSTTAAQHRSRPGASRVGSEPWTKVRRWSLGRRQPVEVQADRGRSPARGRPPPCTDALELAIG